MDDLSIQKKIISIQEPHSILSLDDKYVYAVVPKEGSAVEIFDSKSLDSIRILNAPDEHSFYGHATNIPQLEQVLISGYHNVTLQGKVFVYSTRDFQFIEFFDSFGIAPHDLRYFEKEKILCIANNGLVERKRPKEITSNLVWIDPFKRKKLGSIELPQNEQSFQHFYAESSTDIFAGLDNNTPLLKPKLSLVGRIKNKNNTFLTSSLWKEHKGNILSVAADFKGGLGLSTTPEYKAVVWDLNSNLMKKVISEIAHPHGVIFHSETQNFIISSANDGLWSVDSQLKVTNLLRSDLLRNVGAHMTLVKSKG